MSPQYQGIDPNEKYRDLEMQIVRKRNAIPDFRRDNLDDYFTKKDMLELWEIRQRLELVVFP